MQRRKGNHKRRALGIVLIAVLLGLVGCKTVDDHRLEDIDAEQDTTDWR